MFASFAKIEKKYKEKYFLKFLENMKKDSKIPGSVV